MISKLLKNPKWLNSETLKLTRVAISKKLFEKKETQEFLRQKLADGMVISIMDGMNSDYGFKI